MKKIIILTSVLFVSTILIAVLYFSNLGVSARSSEKVLAYIPVETALIFQFQNDKSFDEIFKDYELFDIVLGKQRIAELAQLKTSLFAGPGLAEAFSDQTVFLSVYPGKADSVDLLWTMTSDNVSADDIYSFLELPSPDFTVQKIEISNRDILAISLKSLNKIFYLFINKNFVTGSFSKDVITKAADKDSPKISADFIKEITSFTQKNENSPFNVFINHASAFSFVEKFINGKADGNFRLLDELGGASFLTMNFKSDAFMFNGISEVDNNTGNYLNVFLGQKPVVAEIKKTFPENTSDFIAFGVSDYNLFHSNLLSLFEKRRELSALTAQMDWLKEKNGINLESDIKKLWASDFATVRLSSNGKLAVMQVNNATQMQFLLKYLSSEHSENIWKFNSPNILYYYFGDPLKSFRNPYYTLVDNYLVAANSPATLTAFTADYMADKLLYKTARFSEFNQLVANQSNIMFFIQNRNATAVMRNTLKRNYFKAFGDSQSRLKDFYGLSYQWSAAGDHFTTNLYANYISTNASKLDLVWKYKLNGRLAIAPQIIADDSLKLVLVQDNVNNVYVFSAEGKKKWSTQLPHKILGEVQQLKDQTLLFNTSTHIYRMDASGGAYRGFPVKLPHPASDGLTVTDPDPEKLKMFVPCRNQIAAFTADGSAVNGWNKPLDGDILFGLKTATLNDVNYIIAGTETGRFYFFDHAGNIIGKAADFAKRKYKNPLALEIKTDTKDSRILTTDTTGAVRSIFLNGKMTENNTGIWSDAHFFDAKNITGSINPEWIFTDKSQLYVYNSDNTLAFNYNFGTDITNRPQYFLSGRSVYQIGIAASQDNLLYLFNDDGSFVKGFPIPGVPNFYVGSFMNNGLRYLICGDKSNNLYVYKL